MKRLGTLILATLVAVSAHAQDIDVAEQLKNINLPDGFKIEVYIDDIANPRQMALGDNGTVFVGTRGAGSVYAVVDKDGDYKADAAYTLLSKREKLPDGTRANMPNGVAFKDGSLYISAANNLLRFDDIESKLEKPGDPVIVASDIPIGKTHFWKYIGFGPDGKLYIPSGAPYDIPEGAPYDLAADEEEHMIILRMDADAKNREVYARGIRNTLGFDWDPKTGDLWFTDHGSDHLGLDSPPDELNRISKPGQHFGFPYVHGQDILDPVHGKNQELSRFTPPTQDLVPHAGVMGMKFYDGDMFPAEYKNAIFITEKAGHRGEPEKSQRVTVVKHDGTKSTSYEAFATGWRVGEKAWGKPVDVLVLDDGSMLVSDDAANAIYRISYTK
ncbi:MAG: PQQ-dependent sugar dehydrogenase [Candidatus Hydrogenedentota bacterium]